MNSCALNKNTEYDLLYHITFCTRYRRKFLTGDIKEKTEKLIKEAGLFLEIDIKHYEIYPEHIQILLSTGPHIAIQLIIQKIKFYIGGGLKKMFPELKHKYPNLFTNSYYVCSKGKIFNEHIQTFIEKQPRSQYTEYDKSNREKRKEQYNNEHNNISFDSRRLLLNGDEIFIEL